MIENVKALIYANQFPDNSRAATVRAGIIGTNYALASAEYALFVESFGMVYNSVSGLFYPAAGTVLGEAINAPANRALTNSTLTVTNASQSFSAANADRRYLLIQNNSPTGVIYVTFGATSTVALGVKIPPGGFYEPNVVPSNSVNIIGDIASNANVVLVAG